MQQEVMTVGVDLAKNVFQVQAIDADGEVLVRPQLRRAEVLKFFCLVAAVPGRDRSMCIGPSLGPRAFRPWP